MNHSSFTINQVYLIRAEHDSELIQFLTAFSKKQVISIATFTAIGALKNANLSFYNQSTHAYEEHSLTYPIELASCLGNISLKDGQPFVHAHAVLSDSKGNTFAGHLTSGIVFAAEIHIFDLTGPKLNRMYDPTTDLSLWSINSEQSNETE
jgi:predicted DNA-binding protein with PD1-like motif